MVSGRSRLLHTRSVAKAQETVDDESLGGVVELAGLAESTSGRADEHKRAYQKNVY